MAMMIEGRCNRTQIFQMRCFDLDVQRIHVSRVAIECRKRGETKKDNRPPVPEVCSQVDDLPRAQADENAHGAKGKPLDPLVGALVRVAQLLLARAQVLHLGHDLGHHLLHPAQFRLDRLQLLGRLDLSPVLRVRADVDVELDVSHRVRARVVWQNPRDAMRSQRRERTSLRPEREASPSPVLEGAETHTPAEDVLEAHVEGRVCLRRERVPRFADDIARVAVVVAHGIFDLACVAPIRRQRRGS